METLRTCPKLPNDIVTLIARSCDRLTFVSFMHTSSNIQTLLLPSLRALDFEKDDFCETCALEGHLELLKWGRENGCAWDTFTCSNAAKRGHVELLKWARDQGCPWNGHSIIEAARANNLELIKYLWENNCDYLETVFTVAAQKGHVEIFNFFHERVFMNPKRKDDFIPYAMVGKFRGIIEMLYETVGPTPYFFYDIEAFRKKFNENPAFFPNQFFCQCLILGRKDILEENPHFIPNPTLCKITAILQEDKETLLKGLTDSVGWNATEDDGSDLILYSFFFRNNKLAMWLLEIGYQWTPEVASVAASAGCLECIEYAVEHHLPFYPEKVFKESACPRGSFTWNSRKRLNIVKWMLKKGYDLPSHCVAESLKSYDLKIFRWFEKRGFAITETEICHVIETKLFWKTISEEKVLWGLDHNGEYLRGHQVSKFKSLQAALNLKNHDIEFLNLSRDPRLQDLLTLVGHGKYKL